MRTLLANRWVVAGFFYLSSALNYLDRLVLAALAPLLMKEFQFNETQYGALHSVFYLVYAIFSPLAGLFLDRAGLTLGISVAVALWSAAGIARGFVEGYTGLVLASALLAVGEAAGIPATAKATRYLKPDERAFGAGMSQVGLSIGGFAAPLIANHFVALGNWQGAFVVPGLLGFFWIPVWILLSRLNPGVESPAAQTPKTSRDIVRDPFMWALFAANLIAMVAYSLWTNWTTLFFTRTFDLPLREANVYAKYPQIFSYVGALSGGLISMWLIRRGRRPADARLRTCGFAAIGMLVTAAVPFMPEPWMAATAICLSFLVASAWAVNLYTIPVDLFGHQSAAFAVSLLTAAYGVLQVVVSPVIGRTIREYGFQPVCLLAAVCPLVAFGILSFVRSRRSEARAQAAVV